MKFAASPRWTSFVYLDFDKDAANTIFLAGTGRAGTTWLSDLLNFDNSYRYMFEPFFPTYVNLVKKYRVRQYLRPDNNDEYYFNIAKKVLSGDIRNIWVDRFNKKILCSKIYRKIPI